MTDRENDKFSKARADIELGLGGLLGELGSALTEAINRLDEAGSGEVQHHATFDSGKGPVRATAGVRIRTLGGEYSSTSGRKPERPINQPAAPKPAQKTDPDQEAASARPINATILENEATWSLVAELPGVSQEDIRLSDGEVGQVVVSAAGRGRNYSGVFDLPPDKTATDISVSMQNGILELTSEIGKPDN